VNDRDRQRFDELFEDALEALPEGVRDLLDDVPVILEDRPDASLRQEMGLAPGQTLCGLHTGIPLTERSVEHSGVLPDEIRLFREGVVRSAGGWRGRHADDAVYEEIIVTLLHEIGHHFGLDEADLEDLGYG